MATLRTLEVDRWSEPDERSRVKHIGMANAKEIFDQLKTHLTEKGLLPDEYFLFNSNLKGELPDYESAICIPNFGGSEGIYLDISLACRGEDGKQEFTSFATGKTLSDTGDAFLQMHRIAAECSLMLNGRDYEYDVSDAELTLTDAEAKAVRRELTRAIAEKPGSPDTGSLVSAAAKLDRCMPRTEQTADQTENDTEAMGGIRQCE